LKEKKLGYISMIAMLVLSMVIMIAPARSGVYPGGAGCTIWVDDQAAHFGPSPDPGNLTCTTDFNVSINLQNAPASPGGVAAWEFKLSYNSTLLNASYVYRPPAWPEPPYTWLPKGADMLWHPDTLPTINDPGGYVWVGCSIPGGSELYGNWTLVTIEFNATEVGSCVLDLYATKLYDSFVTPIVHTALDGSATVVPEFPVAIVMPLLLIATLAVAFLGKMVWSRKRRDAPIAR